MAQRFVTEKTTTLYKEPTGAARHAVLIFGDEVATHGAAQGGRVAATVRGREGWIKADHLGGERALEMYCLDVGTGDATVIVTPGGKTIVIDGGINRRALGFLAWKYQLDDPSRRVVIDLLVLSHADADHLKGLTPILSHPQIDVRQVIHSGIATFAHGAKATALGDLGEVDGERVLVTRHSALAELPADGLSDAFAAWRDAVAAKHCGYRAVDATTGRIDLGDPSVVLEVVGPKLTALPGGGRGCVYFDGDGPTINGHSVVLRLTHGDVSLLLPGDLNARGAQHLLADPALRAQLSAHVLKAPHHGSHDYDPEFLRTVAPQITVISSGDDPDHGHPRACFVGAVGRSARAADPLVFSTAIAAAFAELTEPAAPTPATAGAAEDADAIDPRDMASHRRLFKRRLHGMINVRSSGEELYAARRVAASYVWEAYGPMPAAPAP